MAHPHKRIVPALVFTAIAGLQSPAHADDDLTGRDQQFLDAANNSCRVFDKLLDKIENETLFAPVSKVCETVNWSDVFGKNRLRQDYQLSANFVGALAQGLVARADIVRQAVTILNSPDSDRQDRRAARYDLIISSSGLFLNLSYYQAFEIAEKINNSMGKSRPSAANDDADFSKQELERLKNYKQWNRVQIRGFIPHYG